MAQVITQVDAFTAIPFTGNPAAVCILAEPADERWMQQVALEMNLAETAYLVKQDDGYNLRWFTPATEVDLCGHATLASAHVLWSEGHLDPGAQARFYTRSGLLTAQYNGDWIELNFPAEPAEVVEAPPDMGRALGVGSLYTGKNRFDYLVEVASETDLRRISPDFSLLATLPARGIIVTARPDTGAEYDFVSRFFAPRAGINEDPVTGSAHCCLGPYWCKRLGKTEFVAYQASQRGGTVRVRLDGERVILGGQAVTVMRGNLL